MAEKLQDDETANGVMENSSLVDGGLSDEIVGIVDETTTNSRCFEYIRRVKACFLFLSFIGLGISNAMYGPTILDLAFHTQSEVSEMSYVITTRALGFLFGTVIGGWLFDKLQNKYMFLGGACFGTVIAMFVFPVVESVVAFSLIGFTMTIFAAMLDTGGNVILFILWPKNSQPYMQMLHFMYAVGAFLAPLIAKPFLLPEIRANTTSDMIPNNHILSGLPSVAYAYWLGTIPIIISGAFFLVCAFSKTLRTDKQKEDENESKSTTDRKIKWPILIMFFLFILFYTAIEEVVSSFLFTYAVKSSPPMSPDQAALLTSTFWITYACGRLITVPLTKCLKSQHILSLDIVGCLSASIILLSQVTGGCDSHDSIRLWFGVALLGTSTSSVFPAMFSYVENFMEVTGRVASVLYVGSCTGAMVFPILVGNTFKSIGPCAFLHSISTPSAMCSIFYLIIVLFSRQLETKKCDNVVKLDMKDQNDKDELEKLKEQNETINL